MRKMLMSGLWLLVFSAIGYGALTFVIYIFQAKMTFPAGAANMQEPKEYPERLEKIYLTNSVGLKLQGSMAKGRPANAPVLLGFGGNAHNVTLYSDYLAGLLPDFNVVAFNYRGYGESEGKPSATALLRDGVEIYDWVQKRFPKAPIILIGTSLGSGVSAYVAAHRPVTGVMLLLPYDELWRVAKEAYPILPVRQLFRNNIDEAGYLHHSSAPMAVITAGGDTLISPARSGVAVGAIRHLVARDEIPHVSHVGLLSAPQLDTWIKDKALPAILSFAANPSAHENSAHAAAR